MYFGNCTADGEFAELFKDNNTEHDFWGVVLGLFP